MPDDVSCKHHFVEEGIGIPPSPSKFFILSNIILYNYLCSCVNKISETKINFDRSLHSSSIELIANNRSLKNVNDSTLTDTF